MKRIVPIIIAGVLAASCAKTPEYLHPLTLSTEKVVLPAEESSHIAVVYATKDWKASLSGDVDWLRPDVTSGGSGMSRLKLDCTANRGLSRSVVLSVSDGENEDSMEVVQSSAVSSPVFGFTSAKVEVPVSRSRVSTGFRTNIPDNLPLASVLVSDSEGGSISWIKDVSVQEDRVQFTVEATTVSRTGVITLEVRNHDASVRLSSAISVIQNII